MQIIEIEFDGSYNNQTKRAGYGYTLRCHGIEVGGKGSLIDERFTSNITEYLALLKAIQRAKKEFGTKNVEYYIYGDSRLVCEHVAKRWGWSKKKIVWNPHKQQPYLKKMLVKIFDEIGETPFQITWIRRDKNSKADKLSK